MKFGPNKFVCGLLDGFRSMLCISEALSFIKVKSKIHEKLKIHDFAQNGMKFGIDKFFWIWWTPKLFLARSLYIQESQ